MVQNQPQPDSRRAATATQPPIRLPDTLFYADFKRIAIAASLTPQHVMRVFRGENRASFLTAAKIAAAAGMTLDELRDRIAKVDPEMAQAVRAIQQKHEAA